MNTRRSLISLALTLALLALVGILIGSTSRAAAPVGPARPVPNGAPDTPFSALALPLRFIPNVGQTDSAVQFTVRGAGHTLFFTPVESCKVVPVAPYQSLEKAYLFSSERVFIQNPN